MSKVVTNSAKQTPANPESGYPRSSDPSAAGKPAALSAPATGNPGRPTNWSEIRVGSLVVAQEKPGEGWWEATVAEVRDNMLTLRWVGYPRLPAIIRSRDQIGLLFPAG